MKKSDLYHKWVEWSEQDQVYIGKCPDLITGIHGDDPVRLYSELCEIVEDVIQHFETEGRLFPNPRIRPMQDVAWNLQSTASFTAEKVRTAHPTQLLAWD